MKYLVKFLALLLVSFLTLAIPASALANNGNDKVKGDKNTNAPANPGANTPGPYDPENVGEGDNQGNGKAPDNGTVGNADDKNPPGQLPDGKNDGNKGYECDDNKGVGDRGGNPAHSGCATPTPTVKPSESAKPSPSVKPSESPKNEKVTICHATGSEKNPYVVITVDKNGLNGHGDHGGDIIPVPADGCPVPVASPSPSVTASPTTEPSVTPTTPAPVPTQVTPSVKPPYRDEARPCPKGVTRTPVTPAERISDSFCHRPTPTPTATVEPAPTKAPVFVGPTVPAKVVDHTASDTATVGISELPRTGTNSTALLAYVAVMLLGLGTLCYTLPVALTRVR